MWRHIVSDEILFSKLNGYGMLEYLIFLWNIPSFTSSKYPYHCTRKHILLVYSYISKYVYFLKRVLSPIRIYSSAVYSQSLIRIFSYIYLYPGFTPTPRRMSTSRSFCSIAFEKRSFNNLSIILVTKESFL